jgi:hypothetical protein
MTFYISINLISWYIGMYVYKLRLPRGTHDKGGTHRHNSSFVWCLNSRVVRLGWLGCAQSVSSGRDTSVEAAWVGGFARCEFEFVAQLRKNTGDSRVHMCKRVGYMETRRN